MQPRYQIHLYHDGTQYVAAVPELDGCAGSGPSYAEALASAEQAIAAWVSEAVSKGETPPAPATSFVLRPVKPQTSQATPTMRRLHRQFGNLSNRQLAEKLGLPDVGASAIAAAAAGQGARAVRIALAVALGDCPSRLWPRLSPTKLARDDAAFFEAGGLSRLIDAAASTKAGWRPMDYDERQALYESMITEYRAMFADMNDAARALWFFTMDESVILSFYVGADESPYLAEERHAVKLYAIATALSGLPCAEKERSTIDDLRSMAGKINNRLDVMRRAAGME